MICAVVAHRDGQPGDEDDSEGRRLLGAALSDPNRRHVTLANLSDLADIDGLLTTGTGEPDADDRGDPPPLPQRRPQRSQGRDQERDPERSQERDPQRDPERLPERIVPEPLREASAARASWAQPAERWLLELLAVAFASVAFVSPSVWLLVVAVACVLGGIAAYLAGGNPVAKLPGRALRRAGRLAHPKASLWTPVLAARVVLLAIVLSGGTAAIAWLTTEGREGVVAAARAGVWAEGLRVAAALVCAMLLTSVGDGRQQRRRAVRHWVSPAGDGTLVILAITCCAAAVIMVAAVPQRTDVLATRADGLGWLPSGAVRDAADDLRDDIVRNELNALATCLSDRTGTDWRPRYTEDNATDAVDVARLTATDGTPFSEVTTVLLAAQNQLAPWVDVIEVRWSGKVRARLDRDDLPRRRPLTEASALAPGVTAGRRSLTSAEPDGPTVLDCSVGPVV
jgi:hypothetical protein